MFKNNKYIIYVTITLVALFMFQTVSAATAYVYLFQDETTVASAAVGLSTHSSYSGFNSSISERDLYVQLQRAAPGSSWTQHDRKRISPGVSTGTQNPPLHSSSVNWRLRLYPVGWWATGCHANGWVKDSW